MTAPPAGAGPVSGGRGWRDARALLAGPLRPLVGGQCLGQFADGLAQITFAQFVLFEVEQGATPARIAAVLAVTLLPFSLVGPFAGVLIDRWDRRRTLIVVSLLRALLAVAAIGTVVTESRPAAFLGVLLLLSSSRFVLAAKGAALPRTVPREALVTGNAVSALAGMSASFVGAVGGSLFVGHSTAAGFLIAAALYLAAAAVFTRLPDIGGGFAEPLLSRLRALLAELIDGLRTAAGDTAIRWPLVAVAAHRLLLGAGFVVLVLIADSRYQLEVAGYGLALAATGLAAFAGTLLAPPLARRYSPTVLVPAAFLPAAAAAYVGGLYLSLAVLIASVSVVGFAFQLLKISVDALVGGAAADVTRGRVFAVYDVLYNVAFIVAGLLMVPLWRQDRERALLWLVAAGFVMGWLVVQAVMIRSTPPVGRPVAAGRPRPAGLLAAVVAGVVPVPAFPAPALWWLAWIAVVPLLLVVRAAATPGDGAARAWCGMTAYIVATQYWLAPSAGPGLIGMGLLLGALWLPWGWVTHRLLAGRVTGRRMLTAVLLLPSAWVLAEAARSGQSLGGPWALLGTSQWNQPALLASAAWGGVWLTSFLIMAVNVAVAAALIGGSGRDRTVALTVAAACVAIGPAAACTSRPAGSSGPAGSSLEAGAVRVALVQPGDIVVAEDRTVAAEAITASLGAQRPDLVVWGESSVGRDLAGDPETTARLTGLSRRIGADLLVNVDARAPSGGIHKTAVLIGPDGMLGSYQKVRLVPFGETVPLRPVLEPITRHTKAAVEDRRHGAGPAVLHTDGLTIGPLISFETTFPDLTRRQVLLGADLLAYQSSTSTFQGSWAQPQLAGMVAVRAVESGRPAVHAALSGVSSAFDARGRRLGWLPATERGALVLDVPLDSVETGYSRLGDWVPALAAVLLAAGAFRLTVRRARDG